MIEKAQPENDRKCTHRKKTEMHSRKKAENAHIRKWQKRHNWKMSENAHTGKCQKKSTHWKYPDSENNRKSTVGNIQTLKMAENAQSEISRLGK